jgi:hypothetical protein
METAVWGVRGVRGLGAESRIQPFLFGTPEHLLVALTFGKYTPHTTHTTHRKENHPFCTIICTIAEPLALLTVWERSRTI